MLDDQSQGTNQGKKSSRMTEGGADEAKSKVPKSSENDSLVEELLAEKFVDDQFQSYFHV